MKNVFSKAVTRNFFALKEKLCLFLFDVKNIGGKVQWPFSNFCKVSSIWNTSTLREVSNFNVVVLYSYYGSHIPVTTGRLNDHR